MRMKRTMWSYPWKYAESFSIALGILITGMIMEAALPPAGTFIPAWPGNLIMLGVILLLGFVMLAFRKKSDFVKWMGSGYAAVGLTSAFTLLIIIMGLVPQRPSMHFYHQLGWTYINASWPFYITGLLMVFSLFLSLTKRLKKLNLRNSIFILNHLGLMLILLAGGLGKSDFKEMTMKLKMNKPVWYAYNSQGGRVDLDFALEMNEFNIDYHLPVLQITNEKDEIIKSAELDTIGHNTISFKDYQIETKKVLPEAIMNKQGYTIARHPAAVTAAKLNYRKEGHHKSSTAWISSSNRMAPPKMVDVGNYTISLRSRMPKIYETKAELFTKQGEQYPVNIKVNKPIKVNGWVIYQSSYDQNMGRWSETSTLTIVKDPWLPVIYTGIFMILAGALGMFIKGKSYKVKTEE